MCPQAMVVYTSDDNPRANANARNAQTLASQQPSHAKRYIQAMYDDAYVADMKRRIEWLKALAAERWEFKRLPLDTQARANAWWSKRIAKGSRFEGGADVAAIQESLTQRRYSLEAQLAAHS